MVSASWQTLRALKIVVKGLEYIYPDYALIGGLARNLYTEPLATRDADLLVRLNDDIFIRIYEYLRDKGFSMEPEEQGHWMYKLIYRGARVDLIDHPRFKYTGEAATRRRTVSLKDVGRIMILSPEDLALIHLTSFDPQRSPASLVAKHISAALRIIAYRATVNDFDKSYFIRRCGEHGDLVEALCSRTYSEALEAIEKALKKREKQREE